MNDIDLLYLRIANKFKTKNPVFFPAIPDTADSFMNFLVFENNNLTLGSSSGLQYPGEGIESTIRARVTGDSFKENDFILQINISTESYDFGWFNMDIYSMNENVGEFYFNMNENIGRDLIIGVPNELIIRFRLLSLSGSQYTTTETVNYYPYKINLIDSYYNTPMDRAANMIGRFN